MVKLFHKIVIALLTSLILLLSCAHVNAESVISVPLYQEVHILGNNSYYVDTIYQPSFARSGINGQKTRSYYDSGKLAWTLTVNGSFSYNGTSSSCIGSSVTYTINDGAWSKTSTSSTSNGNTATAYGSFRKNNGQTGSTSVSLSCDRNGNLS